MEMDMEMDKKETAKGSSAKELARYRERVAGLERELEGLQAQNACCSAKRERRLTLPGWIGGRRKGS